MALAGSDVGHIFPVTLVTTGKVRAGVRSQAESRIWRV